jgi:lipoprotein-releasing system ATP-binding protein
MSDLPPAEVGPVPSAAGPQAQPLLACRGLEKSYRVGGGRLDVLRGVDLDIAEGEILAILGKSGCGKSTLLHVLGWLDKPDRGRILLRGRDRSTIGIAERARLRNQVMGFVFQFYHLLPELSALENVLMPALIRHGPLAWPRHRGAERARARELLELVGLSERAKHRPRQLSGGERQRVAIARALQNRPGFLFCDEPTGNLDGKTADDVRRLLWGLNEEQGQTMVVVTHDAKLASQAHRVVHLVDGRIETGREVDLVEEVDV